MDQKIDLKSFIETKLNSESIAVATLIMRKDGIVDVYIEGQLANISYLKDVLNSHIMECVTGRKKVPPNLKSV